MEPLKASVRLFIHTQLEVRQQPGYSNSICMRYTCKSVSVCEDMRLDSRVKAEAHEETPSEITSSAEEVKNQVTGPYLHVFLPRNKYKIPKHSGEV